MNLFLLLKTMYFQIFLIVFSNVYRSDNNQNMIDSVVAVCGIWYMKPLETTYSSFSTNKIEKI